MRGEGFGLYDHHHTNACSTYLRWFMSWWRGVLFGGQELADSLGKRRLCQIGWRVGLQLSLKSWSQETFFLTLIKDRRMTWQRIDSQFSSSQNQHGGWSLRQLEPLTKLINWTCQAGQFHRWNLETDQFLITTTNVPDFTALGDNLKFIK